MEGGREGGRVGRERVKKREDVGVVERERNGERERERDKLEATQCVTFDSTFQVQLACKVQKPLLLHEREAHEAFLKILNKYQADLPAVVCHCFTGRRNEALKYLSMGFYIGITGES